MLVVQLREYDFLIMLNLYIYIIIYKDSYKYIKM